MKVPTKQLQELSEAKSLSPSITKCLMWLYRRSPGYGQSYVIDLHEFNKWIGKSRPKGKYCPAMLRKIRLQLVDLPILKVKKHWRANILEVVILPLKNSQNTETKVKSQKLSSVPQSDDDIRDTADRSPVGSYEQQQHKFAIESLLRRSGFKFDGRKCRGFLGLFHSRVDKKIVWHKIARYSAEAVARSLDYIKIQMTGRRQIRNKEGYLIDCLERGYWRSLSDRDTAKSYWQNLVDNLNSGLELIKQKVNSKIRVQQLSPALRDED